MADPPVDSSLNRFVQAIPMPFGILRRGCAPVEDGSSSEEELEAPEETLRGANFVDLHSSSDEISPTPTRDEEHGAAMLQALSHTAREETMEEEDGNRKPAARPRKKAKASSRTKKKSTNGTNAAGPEVVLEPSVDPPRKKVAKPTQAMEEAYDAGYDSDGWEGPPKTQELQPHAKCTQRT